MLKYLPVVLGASVQRVEIYDSSNFTKAGRGITWSIVIIFTGGVFF